jgi:hypothetical protein
MEQNNKMTDKPEPKKEVILERIAQSKGIVDPRGAIIKLSHEQLSRKRLDILVHYNPSANTISYEIYGAPQEERTIRVPMPYDNGGVGNLRQVAGSSPRSEFNALFGDNNLNGEGRIL